jgi:protein gp37
MSEITQIQWCDSTVNPIPGRIGYERLIPVATVLKAVDEAVEEFIPEKFDSRELFESVLVDTVAMMPPEQKVEFDNYQDLDTALVARLTPHFLAEVGSMDGKRARQAADGVLSQFASCYAARDNNGNGIGATTPGQKNRNIGFAPRSLAVARGKERMAKAAAWADLLGRKNLETPWRECLPRMIFVSDEVDALSFEDDLAFLKSDVVPVFGSRNGRRHLWLWPTRQLARMARISEDMDGGFPPNVCAMTTVTSRKTLHRVDDLRGVKAHIRGLMIEPLWEGLPLEDLDLNGINWVIVGGESDYGKDTRPFALEWAEELRDHCQQQGVAFFLKQLGQKPTRNGQPIKLQDKHGGNWKEWEKTLRIREFPKAFHEYRKDEMVLSVEPRPLKKPKKPKAATEIPVTAGEKADFERLDRIVRKSAAAFEKAGEALQQIRNGELWRAGGFKSWDDYCRQIAGMSRVHAGRLVQASECWRQLKTVPIGTVSPVAESQIRPLLRLADTPQRVEAWKSAVKKANGGSPTAVEVTEAVFEILNPEGVPEKPVPRALLRRSVVLRLKVAIQDEMSYDQLEELLEELKDLL